jgi:glycosyltransferase involved in cell wall biosynthesis
MRIAFLSTHPIQYQAPLFRALHRRPGVHVTALFCHPHGVEPSFDREFGRVIRYDVPLLEGYEYRFLRNLAVSPGLTPTGLINPGVARVLATGEFDALIVHGYSYLTSLLSLVAPRRRTRVLLRGESNLRHRRPPTRLLAKDLALRPLFRRVDGFLSIGSLNRDYYEAYGVAPERITLAPYSVDNDFFVERSAAATRDPGDARRRLGLPNREVLFASVAKLIAKKRPFDLLEAFAQARIADRAGLAYVGDGELRALLEERIRALGLQDSVKLLGFRNQTELPEIYGACDVLILPSDYEPWGLAVNEAMACGAAAFVSDQVGAGPDLVADPACTFAVGDVGRLAEMMRGAVVDPAWRRQLRQRAAARIRGWGIEATADGVLAGVERALGGRGAADSALRLRSPAQAPLPGEHG